MADGVVPASAPDVADKAGAQAEASTRTSPLSGLTADELFWLAALGVGLAAAFGPELIWMFDRWLHSEYYEHGFLIPVVAAWLMYRRREQVAALAAGAMNGAPTGVGRDESRPYIAVIVAGLALHLLAVLVDVNFASGFAMVVTLWGVVAWLWGRRVALALLFPIAYLAFMVPVDRLLIDAFASPLQLLVARMAAAVSHAIGVPVTREGVNVGVPSYLFEVAVPCSGLKSLTAMAALAALYAYGVKGRLWQRLTIFASALPIALVANVARVTLILWVAHRLGANLADGFFHGFSGAVVFGVGLLGLYGVGRLVGCRALRDGI
jgi:exosortase